MNPAMNSGVNCGMNAPSACIRLESHERSQP
jgi:hypothetical protein